MKPMVIDASMAAAWIIDDEKTPAGDQILEESKRIDTITPPLFWYEIRNLLVMYKSAEEAQQAVLGFFCATCEGSGSKSRQVTMRH